METGFKKSRGWGLCLEKEVVRDRVLYHFSKYIKEFGPLTEVEKGRKRVTQVIE